MTVLVEPVVPNEHFCSEALDDALIRSCGPEGHERRSTVLVGIPAASVGRVWPMVFPLIELACRRGRQKESPLSIRAALVRKGLQLWLLWDGSVKGVIVTEIVQHPLKACCRIRICTGRDRQDWQHHLKSIEAWAKAQGCAAMELIARPGWSRFLGGQGYAVTHLFCEKELQ